MKVTEAEFACDRCDVPISARQAQEKITWWSRQEPFRDLCADCWRSLIAILKVWLTNPTADDYEFLLGYQSALVAMGERARELLELPVDESRLEDDRPELIAAGDAGANSGKQKGPDDG